MIRSFALTAAAITLRIYLPLVFVFHWPFQTAYPAIFRFSNFYPLPIGTYDLLIAGQALSRKLTLVTANTKEFARVKSGKRTREAGRQMEHP